jgi:multidrug efflux pump subunit AcrA (membrane-fusion protein)
MKANIKYQNIALTLLLGSLALLAGCGKPEDNAKKPEGDASGGGKAAATTPASAEATPVRVADATTGQVRQTIPVTGSIAATESVDITPQVSAKITYIAAREGASVSAGQVLVRQETRDLETGRAQASAGLAQTTAQRASAISQKQQAQAQLESQRALLNSALSRLKQVQTQAKLGGTQDNTAVQDAEEQVKSAKANLELAKRPQRPEEIQIVESSVAQAEANYEKAVADRKRYDDLFKEGAVAASVAEQYRTSEKVVREQLNSAKAQRDMALKGGRSEQISQAQIAVQRAEWGLKLAKSNTGQKNVRSQEIESAQAAVAQARAGVAQAESALTTATSSIAQASAGMQASQSALNLANDQQGKATIVAPISGLISARRAEVGQIAAPGSPLLTIVALNTVFFEAQVPDTAFSGLQVGMPVEVSVDALANKAFSGRIAKLYPNGNATSRTFTVRIEVPNSAGTLRPGMFARGSVIASQRQGVLVAKDALVTDEKGAFLVFVAEGDKAVKRPVKLGFENGPNIEIREGVKSGEKVVVVGQNGLKDGGKIAVQEAKTQRTAQL